MLKYIKLWLLVKGFMFIMAFCYVAAPVKKHFFFVANEIGHLFEMPENVIGYEVKEERFHDVHEENITDHNHQYKLLDQLDAIIDKAITNNHSKDKTVKEKKQPKVCEKCKPIFEFLDFKNKPLHNFKNNFDCLSGYCSVPIQPPIV